MTATITPDLKAAIRGRAASVGFPLCGFTPVQAPPHAAYVRRWLAEGNAGDMAYIERGLAKRLDPALVLDGARSIISVAAPHPPAPPTPAPARWRETLQGRIAAYARGADYHGPVLTRLDALASSVRALVPGCRTRAYVDTGPILEREWADRAGVGWFGKNTMVLDRRLGSWFFLGEILTDLACEPDAPVGDGCGACRRCLELCPTGALREGHHLDARLCISYLTIEYRGVLPLELRPRLGPWIFGCDVCQDVCPWNADHPGSPAADLAPHLPDLMRLTAEEFRARFRTGAVARAKRAGLLRNAAVALGNSGNPAALPSLAHALEQDPSPLVRAHAAWAIGVLPGGAALPALARARRDPDAIVRTEAECSLSGEADEGRRATERSTPAGPPRHR